MTVKGRVAIGMPLYDHPTAETMVSLVRALAELKQEWVLVVKRSCYLDQSREAIVRDALEAECERLLFIDGDIAFMADAISRILQHEQPIIGGIYNKREFPLVSTVKFLNGDGGYATGSFPMPSAPFQCAAVATGFLSLHLPTISAKMHVPYFEYDHEDGAFMGEDIRFMRLARASGLEVWADPTIPLKHIGEHAY